MCFETIRMMDAYKYIGKTGVLIVDLREEEEYIQGHIPGAWNLPYDEEEEETSKFTKKIRGFIEMQTRQTGIPTKKLLLYCDRGNVSMLAARDLYREGIHVTNLYGGYHAYRGNRTTGLRP